MLFRWSLVKSIKVQADVIRIVCKVPSRGQAGRQGDGYGGLPLELDGDEDFEERRNQDRRFGKAWNAMTVTIHVQLMWPLDAIRWKATLTCD